MAFIALATAVELCEGVVFCVLHNAHMASALLRQSDRSVWPVLQIGIVRITAARFHGCLCTQSAECIVHINLDIAFFAHTNERDYAIGLRSMLCPEGRLKRQYATFSASEERRNSCAERAAFYVLHEKSTTRTPHVGSWTVWF